MSITATFLHAHPQTKIAGMLRDRMEHCQEAKIVSGFATPDGIEALHAAGSADKISTLVLGAATFKAFEALDELIGAGLPLAAARVHLGHSRRTGGRKHPFANLRPMLHSKIYLFDMPDGTSAAFVGSHNLTGFALRGLNGEAAVLIEGERSAPALFDIRAHVAECYRQATPYDSTMKEAYARWYAEYLDRLRIDTQDRPRDSENRRTIILLAQQAPGPSPMNGQRFYFELDRRIDEVKSIDTQVHLYLFPRLPTTPRDALAMLDTASRPLLASVEAIDSGAGSAEVKADWFIGDSRAPVLEPAPRPFRPALSAGKQQVRAQIKADLGEAFDYLFEQDVTKWEPVLGEEELVDDESGATWNPVIGFADPGRATLPSALSQPTLALPPPETSPDSGSFILFSTKRRRRR